MSFLLSLPVLQAGPVNYTTTELYIDRSLILLVAASFFLAVLIMVRRAWVWDWLGYAIAVLLFTFGGVYVWTYVLSLRPDYSDILWARWSVRVVVLMASLNFDAALLFTPTVARPIEPVLDRLEVLADRLDTGLMRLEALEGSVNRVTDGSNRPLVREIADYSGPGDNSP